MSIRSGHRKGPQGGSVVVCSRNVSGTSGPNVRRAVFAVQRVGSRPGGGGAGVPASNTGAVLAAKPSGARRRRGIGNACVSGRRWWRRTQQPSTKQPSTQQPLARTKRAARSSQQVRRKSRRRPRLRGGWPGARASAQHFVAKNVICMRAPGRAAMSCLWCHVVLPVRSFAASCADKRYGGCWTGRRNGASGGTSACGGVGRVRVPHQIRRFDVLPYCEFVPALL